MIIIISYSGFYEVGPTLNQHRVSVSCLLDNYLSLHTFSISTLHWANVGSMLDHRLRLWPNIEPAFLGCILLTGLELCVCNTSSLLLHTFPQSPSLLSTITHYLLTQHTHVSWLTVGLQSPVSLHYRIKSPQQTTNAWVMLVHRLRRWPTVDPPWFNISGLSVCGRLCIGIFCRHILTSYQIRSPDNGVHNGKTFIMAI